MSSKFSLRLASTTLSPIASLLQPVVAMGAELPRIGHLKCCGRQDVLLLQGAAGGLIPYWPGGPRLLDQLHQRGYAPSILNHVDYVRVADAIRQAVVEKRLSDGVLVVGYSFGADSACLLADRLDRYGLTVSRMVLIESTWGIPVPHNVRQCINYYKTRLLDFIPSSRGIAVSAVSERTQLTNVNVREHRDLLDLARCSHFTIGNSSRMHELVLEFLCSAEPHQVCSAA